MSFRGRGTLFACALAGIAGTATAQPNVFVPGNPYGPPITPTNPGTPPAYLVGVVNTGDAVLTFDSITLSGADAGDFAVGTPLPTSLNPSASTNIYVLFDPDSAGEKTVSLDIATNDPDEPLRQVAISGVAVNNLTASQSGTAYFQLVEDMGTPVPYILEIDLSTGDRTLLSSDSAGSGPAFRDYEAGGVVVEDDDSLLALFGDVYRIDRTTGDRTVVSSDSVGSGPTLSSVRTRGLAIEPGGATAIVAVPDFATFLRVDLATGDRTVVSSGSVGTGPSPSGGFESVDIAPDGTIYACDLTNFFGPLFRIDPLTGDRTASLLPGPLYVYDLEVMDDGRVALGLFENQTGFYNHGTGMLEDVSGLFGESMFGTGGTLLGDGPYFEYSRSIGIGPESGRLFIGDGLIETLYRVDIATGDRAVVSSTDPLHPRGSGPAILGAYNVSHLAIDEPPSASVDGWARY